MGDTMDSKLTMKNTCNIDNDNLEMQMLVHWDQGLMRMADDADFYLDMLNSFSANNGIIMQAIKENWNCSDKTELLNSVHALKGVSRNLSLDKLAEKLANIEISVAHKVDKPSDLEALQKIYIATCEKIDDLKTQYV